MPDFLTAELVRTLLEAAVAGGLCAGVLALWQVRWLRGVVIVQAAAVAVLAAVLFAVSLYVNEPPVNVPLGSWLDVEPFFWQLELSHHFRTMTGVLALGISLPVLLTSLSRKSAGADRDDLCRFFLYQAALQFMLFGNPVIKLALLALMSVCGLFWSAGADVSANAAVTVRRRFLFRMASNAAILMGMLFWLRLSRLPTPGFPEGWLIGLGVLGHVLSHALFANREGPYEPDLLDRLIVAPAAIWLLFGATVPMTLANPPESALLLGGVMMAVVGTFAALANPERVLENMSLALSGMMLAAVMGGADSWQVVLLLFVSHAVLLPVLGTGSSARSWARGPAVLGALCLALGVTGQAGVLDHLWETNRVVADGIVLRSILSKSGIAVACLGVAQIVLAFVLGRTVRTALAASHTDSGGDSAQKTSACEIVSLAAVSAVLALIVVFHSVTGWVPTGGFALLAVALTCAIAMTAGWITGGKQRAIPLAGRLWSALKDRFHPAEILVLVFALPLRGLAQLCRFLDWIVIGQLWDGLARVPRWLQRLGEPLQAQSTVASVLTVLLATVVLLGVILGLGN